MDAAYTSGTMAVCMMVFGSKIKLVVKDSMCGQMAEGTKENGRITTCMARASIHGKMDVDMRASTLMIESTDLVFILGRMADNTKVTGIMVSSMVKEFTDNHLELSVAANGRTASVLHG